MASEYGIPCHIEALPYIAARWPVAIGDDDRPLKLPYTGAVPVLDRYDREALLFASDWAMSRCADENAHVRFHDSL